MEYGTDWRLHLRMLAALALALGVAAVVATSVIFGSAWFLTVVGAAPAAGVSPWLLVGAVGVATVLLVAWELRAGYRRALDAVPESADEPEQRERVTDHARRLAARADVTTPRVLVADAEVANSFVVRYRGRPTIAVTTALCRRLDDDELEAVLAHEIAHLRNRDAGVGLLVGTLAGVTDRLLQRERRLAVWIRFTWMLITISLIAFGILFLAIPMLVLVLLFGLVSVAARALVAVNGVSFAVFLRAREFAADREAARLTGKPAALASALTALYGDGPPATDRRLHETAAIGVVPRPLASDAVPSFEESSLQQYIPEDGSDLGGQERADAPENQPHPAVERAIERVRAAVSGVARGCYERLRWQPATHPDVDRRVERLHSMAGDGSTDD